jgi:hypothetical protein
MFARSQLAFSVVSILNQFQSFKDLKSILRKVGEAACRFWQTTAVWKIDKRADKLF